MIAALLLLSWNRRNFFLSFIRLSCMFYGTSCRVIAYVIFGAEQCEKEKARVLVHCMSGKNRSPAIVMGYLMKCKGWRLPQSFHWVKDRRPQVELSPAVHQQLVEYEERIFGSNDAVLIQSQPPPDSVPQFGFGFGFPRSTVTASVPVFNKGTTPSIFERPPPTTFTFGAGNEAPMDSA